MSACELQVSFPQLLDNLAARAEMRFLALGVVAYGDLNTVVGEDQRRVGSGQLSVRHFDCICRGARCCDSKGLLTWDVETELEIRERENN